MRTKAIALGIILSLAAIFGISCQRDPIIYPTGDYYVAIALEGDNDTASVTRPRIYSVNFYDTTSHHLLRSTYIHADNHPQGMPYGGYVTGVEGGVYDILVYNIGTSATVIRNYEYLNQAYATSNLIGRSNDVPVVYAPDQLYLYSDRVKLPYVVDTDGVYIIDAPLSKTAEEWTVIVYGVKNLDIAKSISFFLSGQTLGKWLSPVRKLDERAIVGFAGAVRPSDALSGTKSGEDLIIYTGYTTFGKLEADQRILLTLQIIGPNDSAYYGQVDVTDQVLAAQDGDHVIIVDSDIEIKPREDGGFNPHANPWDPDVTVIILD